MCPLFCSFCTFRVLNYLQLLTNISETLVCFVLMLQFYFTTRAELDYLDGKHTVSGFAWFCQQSWNFPTTMTKKIVHFVQRIPLDLIMKNGGALQVFGEIAEGLDTLMRINEAFVDENHKPYKNIRYTSCFINMTSKIGFSVFEDLKSLVLVHQTYKPNVNSWPRESRNWVKISDTQGKLVFCVE